MKTPDKKTFLSEIEEYTPLDRKAVCQNLKKLTGEAWPQSRLHYLLTGKTKLTAEILTPLRLAMGYSVKNFRTLFCKYYIN